MAADVEGAGLTGFEEGSGGRLGGSVGGGGGGKDGGVGGT